MDHSSIRLARLLACLAAALLGSGAAYGLNMAPHRALYDLEMAKSSQKARLDGVIGKLAYEITGSACDGWNTSYRIVNQFRYKEGEIRLIDMQSLTWESGDGKELSFSQKQFIDSKLSEEKRLSVKRPVVEGEGAGSIELPAQKAFKVPPDALFPMRHQFKLVEAAIGGKTSDNTLLFNGSEEDKTVQVLSTIGKKMHGGSPRDRGSEVAASLRQTAAWPVNMGYFPSDKPQAETPEFQVSFDLYENGVTTNLLLDYGDVVLKGKLVGLDMLEPETCD
jgi:EipB-like